MLVTKFPGKRMQINNRRVEKVDVKDQLSSAVSAFKKKEENLFDDQHQFEAPTEFIKKDIEIPETINVGELAKLMAVKRWC